MKISQSINNAEILLVDDTPEHIETVVSILSKNNYKIKVATKGSTAIKLINQNKPDLILLDVYMPEMSGFELCQIIKNDKLYHDIPIIFLTANNDEESIKKGFELGAQDYVVKPFNIPELLARVNTHIRLLQQTNKLKEAYQELDSFCYSVSHDLKSPLFSISKLIEIFSSDYFNLLNSEGKELLENISEKSHEVITMIDRLLEFSKICKIEMKKEPINLNTLFMKTASELINIHENRTIELNIKNLPVINGDEVMIHILVLNILSNAIKYTKNKEITTIDIISKEDNNHYIISVKDNGVGFDMKYSSRLFGVFQRLHSSKEFEGSGVGLATSQRILKRHKGKAWMEGELNRGATFYFSFPKNT